MKSLIGCWHNNLLYSFSKKLIINYQQLQGSQEQLTHLQFGLSHLFSGILILDIASGGGLIGSSSETDLSRLVGYVFFVWLSVANLFVTSVFWAFMVDIYTVEQGKRVFAFIGIGGTLGALIGGWATSIISSNTESPYLPVGLMLTGAAFFGLSIFLVLLLDRITGSDAPSSSITRDFDSQKVPEVDGPFWEGLRAVLSSPYLLGIGLYVILMAISNTLIYFAQANIVFTNTDTFSERVAGFAQFDALAQALTLITQLFITTHLIKRLGVGWTLSILPAVTILGFATLSIWTASGQPDTLSPGLPERRYLASSLLRKNTKPSQ